MARTGEDKPDLTERGELGRDDEHVLLLDELAACCRRPGAGRARLVADPEPLGPVLIGPDMDPLIEPAGLGWAAEGERGRLGAPSDPLGQFPGPGRAGPSRHVVGAV